MTQTAKQKIENYQQKVEQKLAEAEEEKRIGQERVSELERRFMKLGERFIVTVKRREAQIKRAYNSTTQPLQKRQEIVKNLQTSQEVSDLTENQNRHLNRILEGPTSATKNGRDYYNYSSKDFPQPPYRIVSKTTFLEKSLSENNVNDKIEEQRMRIRNVKEKFKWDFKPGMLSNKHFKLRPKQGRESEQHENWTNFSTILDEAYVFYRALLETREMKPEWYFPLEKGKHKADKVIDNIEKIAEEFDEKASQLDAEYGVTRGVNWYVGVPDDWTKPRNYEGNHVPITMRKSWERDERAKSIRDSADEKIKIEINGLIKYFEKIHGATPAYALQEKLAKLPHLARECYRKAESRRYSPHDLIISAANTPSSA